MWDVLVVQEYLFYNEERSVYIFIENDIEFRKIKFIIEFQNYKNMDLVILKRQFWREKRLQMVYSDGKILG